MGDSEEASPALLTSAQEGGITFWTLNCSLARQPVLDLPPGWSLECGPGVREHREEAVPKEAQEVFPGEAALGGWT